MCISRFKCCFVPFDDDYLGPINCRIKDCVPVEYLLWIVFAPKPQTRQQNLGQRVDRGIYIFFCFFFLFFFLHQNVSFRTGVLFFCLSFVLRAQHFTSPCASFHFLIRGKRPGEAIDDECAVPDQRYMLQLHFMTQEEM